MKFVKSAIMISAIFFFMGSINALAGQGELYILTVGVEPELTAKNERDPYAGDAMYVRQALARAETHYTTTHSRVLSGKHASRANVLKALDWLVASVREGDVAIIFFSTHGDVDPKKGYHIDLFGTGDANDEGLLWGIELNTGLAKVRGQTILFLDTCSAGAILTAGEGKAPRVAVVAACSAEEASDGQWKRKDRPHGWFVIALCEAFGGRADNNQDGVVTLGEVNSYLPARAKHFYNEQNAVVSLEEELAKIPLAQIDQNSPAVLLWPPRLSQPAANSTKDKRTE